MFVLAAFIAFVIKSFEREEKSALEDLFVRFVNSELVAQQENSEQKSLQEEEYQEEENDESEDEGKHLQYKFSNSNLYFSNEIATLRFITFLIKVTISFP